MMFAKSLETSQFQIKDKLLKISNPDSVEVNKSCYIKMCLTRGKS